jgi:methenyltetrahydrofolate cyclohydrolase
VADAPYLEQRLDEFLEGVSSAERTPGGGSVAALLVAMAAGLVAKAARISRPRWPEADGAAARADMLRDRAAANAQRDAELYLQALSVLAERTEENPAVRDFELGRSFALAAEPPLELADIAADTVMLAEEVARKSDPSVRVDVEVAAVLAAAAARVAAELVAVNLTATEADERVHRARVLAESAARAAAATRDPSQPWSPDQL